MAQDVLKPQVANIVSRQIKTLVLGQIPDDYSPDTHIAIAPFCFLDREHVYPDWETLEFQPDPWGSPEAFEAAGRETAEYYKNFLPGYVNELNAMNGLKYSVQFWRMMVNPWLMNMIEFVWEKHQRINDLIQRFGDDELKVSLIKDTIDWQFESSPDFTERGMCNYHFHEWLFSRLLENRIPARWQVTYRDCSAHQSEFIRQGTVPITPKSILKKMYGKWFSNSFQVYRLKRRDVWRMKALVRRRGNGIKGSDDTFESPVNRTFDDWPEVLPEIIRQTCPRSVREVCKTINVNKRRFDPARVHLVSSSNLWNDDFSHKPKLAQAKEHGEKVIGIQHGGHDYGTGRVDTFLHELEYRQDRFITWGWDRCDNYAGDYLPLPSPMLSQCMDEYQRRTDKIVMVSIIANLLDFRTQSTPQPLGWLRYRREKCDFINGLNDTTRIQLAYRPLMNETGALRDAGYVEEKFPSLEIIRDNFHDELFGCRLLVMDNPSTTMNIGMAANIPMIAFWKPEDFPLARDAQPYFDRLRAAGILFDSGHAAAAKINQIWPDIETWWGKAEIQKARSQWVNRFALCSHTWKREWVRALQSL